MAWGYLSFLNELVKLRKEQWLSPESVSDLQRERLEKIVSAASDSGFYYSILSAGSLGPGDIAEDPASIPVTEKKDIRLNMESFLNPKADPEHLLCERTSGSTGTPMKIFMDPYALRYRAALTAHDQLEFGRRPSDLYLEISQRPIPPFPLSRFGIFRKITLSVFDDEKNLFSKVRDARPDILAWYPSVTSVMAKLNDAHGRPLKLKSVYSGAELLTRETRGLIEDSFSCPVFEQYASTEFGVIAWECPEEHSLHVNSNSMLVEIVDQKGKPKRSGTGRVVVTGFFNKAMPLLRYSIGDLASWGKECSCGRGLPVLKSIEGRNAETLVLPSGRCVWPSSLATIHDVPGILQYQIVQVESDLLVFRYVTKGPPLPESSIKDITERISRACYGEGIRLEFERADSIKRKESGKFPYIMSKVRKRCSD